MPQMKLEDFLAEPHKHGRNEWCRYEDADVYVRYSTRALPEGRRLTLELASLNRRGRTNNCYANPKLKSTGFMRRLMNDIEDAAKAKGLAVYIENVMNEFLPDWFRRRGYSDHPMNETHYTECFYMETTT